MFVRVLLTTAALLTASSSALADVGPAPRCAAGTHSEYWRGRHCVPDGSHIDTQTGDVVRDGAPSPRPRPTATTSTTVPTATAPASAPATATASAPVAPAATSAPVATSEPAASAQPTTSGSAPVAEPPGTRKTCAVTSPGVSTSELGVLGVLMALAASAWRRQRAS